MIPEVKAVIFVKNSERLPGKHLMEICGEPMVRRIYRNIESTGLFDYIVIYSKYSELAVEGCNVERDQTTGTLIDSILSSIKLHGEFLAVGGDMPFLGADLIFRLVKEYDGRPLSVVDSDGTVEPLLSIYNPSIFDDLYESSRHSKEIYRFIRERFVLLELEQDESSELFNVNTQEDLNKARRMANCPK